MKHLWEIEHPYYCSSTNYYSNDTFRQHESWADFYEDEMDSDMDLNLVFRWDWNLPTEDNDFYLYTLKIFFMGQRKGLFRCAAIKAQPEDEEAVKLWLQPRWEHLKKLWEPFDAQEE